MHSCNPINRPIGGVVRHNVDRRIIVSYKCMRLRVITLIHLMKKLEVDLAQDGLPQLQDLAWPKLR